MKTLRRTTLALALMAVVSATAVAVSPLLKEFEDAFVEPK